MLNLLIKHAGRPFQIVGPIGAFCLAVALTATANADTWHVDDNAQPGGDGTMWNTAFFDLQDALLGAALSFGPDVIRVAQGTYKPTYGDLNRSASFELIQDVRIEGGYRGPFDAGGDPDDRDIATFVTILSGDIVGDDGAPGGGNSENSYHVVKGIGVDNFAVLDGFTITAGYASGSGDNGSGGGIFLQDAWPLIKNCTITDNQATATSGLRGGGGIFIEFFGTSITTGEFVRIERCTISNNTSANNGGGIYAIARLQDAAVAIIKCTISGNTATNMNAFGGGVYAQVLGPGLPVFDVHLVNCTIEGNWAAAVGGGVGTFMTSQLSEVLNLRCTNCLFVDNGLALTAAGGAIGNFGSNATITNCTFTGNEAGFGGAHYEVDTRNVSSITNSILWGNMGNGHEIFAEPGTHLTVGFSDVQGGEAGIEGPVLYEQLTFPMTNIDVDPSFNPEFGNCRLFTGSPCIDAARNDHVPADEFDVNEDGDLGEKTPDLDLRDRLDDDPDTPDCQQAPGQCGSSPVVDMGSYEFEPCPADANGDCVVNVLDLIAFLLCFGQPAVPNCEAADMNNDGAVNVLDLIVFLLAFGDSCYCASQGTTVKSLEEELNEAGLTMEDWDDFMDVMQNGTEEEKENYICWMIHYLSECPTINCPPPHCPDEDPFDQH